MPNKITIRKFDPRESSKNIRFYRRENSFWKELALIDLKSGESILEARFYGSAYTVYCVVWFHGYRIGSASARGCGKAGGYGYHKPSAALDSALKDAGFSLSADIHGVGDSAMESALQAIAEHVGLKRVRLHISHA